MEIKKLHELYLSCKGVTIDTRNVSINTMFFALKGDNFNGNTFAKLALDNGAKYAIVDELKYKSSNNTILVNNVLNTLQALASYHRMYLKTPIIALTGSNGKTTTKELINTILLKKYNTIATKGNLNNHIGVPLTLLRLTKKTEIGIVEMGANHQKEIDFLCKIAKPDFGYITNFGKAHLEGFGGINGVIMGKSELYQHLINNRKHVFFNEDDSIQTKKLNTYSLKSGFSSKKSKHTVIKLLEVNPFVKFKVKELQIQSQLIGKYNFTNLCAATAIGTFFSVQIEDIKKAIENYKPSNNRSQIITKNKKNIILDAYNANPTSMKAALEHFSNLKTKTKIVFLGDMFELGRASKNEHQKICNLISQLSIDKIYLIGEHFNNTTSNSNKIVHYPTFEALKKDIININTKDATILIKGSRGMALERILELV